MTTLQKIKKLQYFDGLQKLKVILEEFFSSITALEINKVIVGEFTIGEETLTQGDVFIPGKIYTIDTLETGDDFSNIGYVSEGVEFIATGTTPTTWTNNSEVSLVNRSITTYYNDLDPNIYIENIEGTDYNLKITNNGFLNLKTFPNVVGGSAIEVIDTNTIKFNAQNNPKYFKIEVYN